MGRRYPSASLSLQKKRSRTHITLLKNHGPQKLVLVERLEGKPGTTSGDSQGSPEQRSKEGKKKKSKWKDATKDFHEARLHIKERKTSWQKSFKESQKRQELKAQTRADKGTKIQLQDCA